MEKFIHQQQMLFKIRYEEIENLSDNLEDSVEKCLKDLWPLLALVNGNIIDGLRIGSEVRVSCDQGNHRGFVLGMTSVETNHLKISGNSNSIEAPKAQIQLLNSEEKESLYHLCNVRTLKFLHIISLWSRQIERLVHPKKMDQHKRKRSKKPNAVSVVMAREKRSSSLPESRATTSGMELLTNQLVSR